MEVHLPVELKRALSVAAAERGVRLNVLVLEALAAHPDVSKHVEGIGVDQKDGAP